MAGGRPPSPRTEAADQVLRAFDELEESERRSHWKGVAWESRFPYSAIRNQVRSALPLRADDTPGRRGNRADAATRAGLIWARSPKHRYLVKEPDGRYGRWSSVAGVLFEMERRLSDIRLLLEKVAKEGPDDPTSPYQGTLVARQRAHAKLQLASEAARAVRALDGLELPAGADQVGLNIDFLERVRVLPEDGAARDPHPRELTGPHRAQRLHRGILGPVRADEGPVPA